MQSNKHANGDLSDVEDDFEDGVSEQVLRKLRRQLRRLESDRQRFTRSSKAVLRRQKLLIETLVREKTNTTADLENAGSQQNQIKDNEVAVKITQLLSENDEYVDAIADEKNIIANLNEEIRKYEEELKKEQARLGEGHHDAYHRRILKKKDILETRMDNAQVKFSTQLHQNKLLRQRIANLRKERSCYDEILDKLNRELDEIRSEMNQVMEVATAAYEQRKEFQTKMIQMQERNTRDQKQFDLEMKELQRIISHDEKLKEFMTIKARDRAEYVEEENMKKERASANSEKHLDQDHQFLLDYETAFERIKEITGKDDLHVIVNDFIEKEDDNFALFNYVNELGCNNEILTEQCANIKQAIERFEEECIRLEGQRKESMLELEKKLEQEKQLVAVEEKRLEEGELVLNDVKLGIRDLFDKIECDERPVADLLGQKEIRDTNIMIYLGLIEQRTNELLAIQQFVKEREEPEKKQSSVVVSTGSDEGSNIKVSDDIQPPSMEDVEDESGSEDEDKPLSHWEIKQKLLFKKTMDIRRQKTPSSGQQSGRSKDGKKKKTTFAI